jgi:hypothetical protein
MPMKRAVGYSANINAPAVANIRNANPKLETAGIFDG